MICAHCKHDDLRAFQFCPRCGQWRDWLGLGRTLDSAGRIIMSPEAEAAEAAWERQSRANWRNLWGLLN